MEGKEIKARGVKRGETPAWKVGRKATGLLRNKMISFKFTEEEQKVVNQYLKEIGGTKTEALLKIIELSKKVK